MMIQVGLMTTMMSKSDFAIIQKVLSMDPKTLEEFFSRLEPGAKGYLDGILAQYEKLWDL